MSSVEGHLVLCVPVADVAAELGGDAEDLAALLDLIGMETAPDQAAYALAVVDNVPTSGWELLEALAAAVAIRQQEEGL